MAIENNTNPIKSNIKHKENLNTKPEWLQYEQI